MFTKDRLKILMIGAHYDDIELSAGGTLRKFLENGHQAYCIIVTKSDYTNYDTKNLRSVSEAETEGINALCYLGVRRERIYNLGIETKRVTHCPEVVEKINKIIDDVKPNLIITHNLADSHQDHIATAKCTLSASRNQKNIWMYESLFPSKLSNVPCKPIIYVNIDDTLKNKIRSLKLHKGQFAKYPNWVRLITAIATLRGVENNCKYAEAFEPIKTEFEIPDYIWEEGYENEQDND